jgi:hypothetical protein
MHKNHLHFDELRRFGFNNGSNKTPETEQKKTTKLKRTGFEIYENV